MSATTRNLAIKRNHRLRWLILAILVLLLASASWYLLKHKSAAPQNAAHTQTIKTSSPSNPPTNTSAPSTASSSDKSNSISGNPVQPSRNGSGPNAPSGPFVSNHSPSLGQTQSNRSSEVSVCNSTPGANCYIQFTSTSDGTVIKLPAHTVNSDGSTSWSWDVRNSGFTPGTWQITAVATLNGQSESVQDGKYLVVSS